MLQDLFHEGSCCYLVGVVIIILSLVQMAGNGPLAFDFCYVLPFLRWWKAHSICWPLLQLNFLLRVRFLQLAAPNEVWKVSVGYFFFLQCFAGKHTCEHMIFFFFIFFCKRIAMTSLWLQGYQEVDCGTSPPTSPLAGIGVTSEPLVAAAIMSSSSLASLPGCPWEASPSSGSHGSLRFPDWSHSFPWGCWALSPSPLPYSSSLKLANTNSKPLSLVLFSAAEPWLRQSPWPERTCEEPLAALNTKKKKKRIPFPSLMEYLLQDKEYVDGNQLMGRKGDPHIDQGSREE